MTGSFFSELAKGRVESSSDCIMARGMMCGRNTMPTEINHPYCTGVAPSKDWYSSGSTYYKNMCHFQSKLRKSCGNVLTAGVCVVLLGGCAVTHVSEEGKVQVYGLAFGEVEETTSKGSIVASSLNIRTIGLGINLLPQQNSLTFGYNRVSGVLLQNDVFISVDKSARSDGLMKVQLELIEALDRKPNGAEE